jgi:UPF0755 protein
VKRLRRVVVLVAICGILAMAGYGLYAFEWAVGPSAETFVEIAPGTPSRQIAGELARRGIIASKYAFAVLRLVRGGTLKAGEYRFDEPRKLSAVYEQIERGEVYTLTVTIPEGANLFDVAKRVQAANLGSYAGFLAAAQRDGALAHGLDPQARSLEGYLFPDTYHFSRSATPEQMLRAMVRRFGQEAALLGLAGADVRRVVTLASLVERETPIDAERPLVASVLLNRLSRGMLLETDPTVIYAAMLAGRYRGTIYQRDLAAESPYNTYLHVGLPPGPICNPGAVSLRAAMEPAKTRFLYFVAEGSDPQGRSRFAETLEEHQRNVAAYRRAKRSLGAR